MSNNLKIATELNTTQKDNESSQLFALDEPKNHNKKSENSKK